MRSIFDKLHAILRRDLLIAVRHRSGFIITLIGVFSELAAFYFLSKAIGPGFRPDGVAYFPFLLVGTGVYTFFVMSAQAFLSTVQEAQQTGTLEVLMTTSTSPVELIVLSSISAFSGKLANFVIYLLAGVAIFRASTHANFLACAAVLILSVAIAVSLGIAAATLQVASQKGQSVVWLLGSGLWFLSGTMFPVESLPKPLQFLAHLNPLSYAIGAAREALLQGTPISALRGTLAILAGFSLILLPLAIGGLTISLRRARQSGTLSFY